MITDTRRGELCALGWTNVDLDRATLWVPLSIAQTKAGLKEKPTKTKKGRRVALDPHTVELLAEHRGRCRQRCQLLGVQLASDAYLFSPAPDYSTPFVPRSITQRYRRMGLKLHLRSTRLHSLRHYSATELLAAGVDLRTVAGRLGHGSGGATTLKVYAAWVDTPTGEQPPRWPRSCPSRYRLRAALADPMRPSPPSFARPSRLVSLHWATNCPPWLSWRRSFTSQLVPPIERWRYCAQRE